MAIEYQQSTSDESKAMICLKLKNFLRETKKHQAIYDSDIEDSYCNQKIALEKEKGPFITTTSHTDEAVENSNVAVAQMTYLEDNVLSKERDNNDLLPGYLCELQHGTHEVVPEKRTLSLNFVKVSKTQRSTVSKKLFTSSKRCFQLLKRLGRMLFGPFKRIRSLPQLIRQYVSTTATRRPFLHWIPTEFTQSIKELINFINPMYLKIAILLVFPQCKILMDFLPVFVRNKSVVVEGTTCDTIEPFEMGSCALKFFTSHSGSLEYLREQYLSEVTGIEKGKVDMLEMVHTKNNDEEKAPEVIATRPCAEHKPLESNQAFLEKASPVFYQPVKDRLKEYRFLLNGE
ncbi:hypothetical protein RUM43_005619 [Polyplax serrata]|uniref:Uncharacterized protein n=1 Tax=Polyplax serrata TaxID=468196 RepID=A0AAN8NQI7_POLSC